MKTQNKLTYLVLVVATAFLTYGESLAQENTENNTEIEAKLSGTAFVTHDLEASIRFYTEFLGFTERKRIDIDTPNGKAVFGVTSEGPLAYVALVHANFSKENVGPGLNFIEIAESKPTPFSQVGGRTSIAGELVMAYAVRGLTEIEERMRAANVPIVTPLALSATGKSQTLTVLDPNGIRIQMYEYVKK